MNGLYTIEVNVVDWNAYYVIKRQGTSSPLKAGVAKAGFGMDVEDFIEEIGGRITEQLQLIAQGE